jgi:pimeloyl-ACP methyl ester carboxylesterase/predicted glycosyltransferase
MTGTLDRVGMSSDTGSRAREPDATGVVERDGVRTHWARYGTGEPAILLFPAWSIVHSRIWKGQIPYLARRFTVVTFDPRGNGLSDRPSAPSAYDSSEYVDDGAAVLDAAGLPSACVAGLSLGALYALQFAARYPERTLGAALLNPTVPHLVGPDPKRAAFGFDDERETYEGWARFNRHAWLRDFPGFLEFFFSEMFPEPHSSKQIEDCVAWGLDSTPESLIATTGSTSGLADRADVEALCRRVRCPVVVAHGTDDRIVQFERGPQVAELTGGAFVRLEHSGHGPQAREPVVINLLLRDLLERVSGAAPAARSWTRPRERPKRALFVSSPIGLGHARRDVAIAAELRRQVPGLEIEWLAQEPVSTVLRACGETIHPASAELASETEHIDREAGEHDLHAFQAIRRMDEILCANFMLFHDVVREQQYDLWIGDEAWEVDHFLHENPELKTAPFAWLTDFVGFLPMPAGGEREAFLTADTNAEMIEHVERFPRVRDRAIFVGDPDDVTPGSFGPGLPEIREWTHRHYDFAGYVPGFDPRTVADRQRLRSELGYGDEPLCIVSVGGSGVGAPLLRRVIESLPLVRERIPNLRTIAVAGPRIDPASLPTAPGLEVHGYVHELYRHLAACDVAIVQGGLTTTMELVAAQRPFVSVPLASHFEQRFHVRHRLDRYGARAWLDYEDATPEALAGVLGAAIGSEPGYLAVDGGGAARAAALIAELL